MIRTTCLCGRFIGYRPVGVDEKTKRKASREDVDSESDPGFFDSDDGEV